MWTKSEAYFEGSSSCGGTVHCRPHKAIKKTSFIHKRNKSFNAHRRVVIRALFSHLAQHLPTLAPSTGSKGRGHGLYVLQYVVPCGHRRRTGQFLLSTKWSLLCSANVDADGLLHVALFHVDFNDSNYGAARRKSFLSIACIIVIVSAQSSLSLSLFLFLCTVASKLLCFVWPFHCVGVVRSLRLPVCSWSSPGYSWKCPTRAGSCRAAPARLYVMCLYAHL